MKKFDPEQLFDTAEYISSEDPNYIEVYFARTYYFTYFLIFRRKTVLHVVNFSYILLLPSGMKVV